MASIAFDYTCNKDAGFVMDPNVHTRFGYVCSLGGLGLTSPLARDLLVSVPFNAGAPPTFSGLRYQSSAKPGTVAGSAKVVGVIEKFSWAGGVGDPITLVFYVSQVNAMQIKTLQQTTMKTTSVSGLAWWIADYDQETRMWYEQAFPMGGSVTGVLRNTGNPALNVDLTPVVANGGINGGVYKVSLTVAPGANTAYTLQFANSSKVKTVKSWGLVVGTLAG